MRVAVTGGAGFIGSHLVDALVGLRHAVLVIDDLSTGKRENLNASVKFEQADIREDRLSDLLSAFKPDAVFHLAAQVSVPDSIRDPDRDFSINAGGSQNVLAAAILSGAEYFVNVSTGIVYGDQTPFVEYPISETADKRLPFPYSRSKYEFERVLVYAAERKKIRGVSVRPGNVYGPRQDPCGEAGVVAIFCSRIIAGKPLVIHGTGEATRDYVYVDDAVDALLLALTYLESGRWRPPTSISDLAYNVGAGVETPVTQIAALLEDVARSRGIEPSGRDNGPPRSGEVMRIALDSSKAARDFEWNPKTDLKSGLVRTFDWFLQSSPSGVK
ncbi:MAG: NAD-dependent epimerase/dehydratase family protein [bacterium]